MVGQPEDMALLSNNHPFTQNRNKTQVFFPTTGKYTCDLKTRSDFVVFSSPHRGWDVTSSVALSPHRSAVSREVLVITHLDIYPAEHSRRQPSASRLVFFGVNHSLAYCRHTRTLRNGADSALPPDRQSVVKCKGSTAEAMTLWYVSSVGNTLGTRPSCMLAPNGPVTKSFLGVRFRSD